MYEKEKCHEGLRKSSHKLKLKSAMEIYIRFNRGHLFTCNDTFFYSLHQIILSSSFSSS